MSLSGYSSVPDTLVCVLGIVYITYMVCLRCSFKEKKQRNLVMKTPCQFPSVVNMM